ncbi:MAG: hypothetical protein EOM20_00860 [Spartobacteria bacterium]|nr:hypothetical protein [Spartobacteria bacterium]
MIKRIWVIGAAVAGGMLLGAGRGQASSLWPPQNLAWSRIWAAEKTDPVDANAGGYYFSLPLLELGGPMGLGFHLDYRSNRASAMPVGDLPSWGKWGWSFRRMLSVNKMSGTNYYQFELADGEAVAFRQNPDDSFSLVDTNTFGVASSGSPKDYQLKGDTNWLYLLNPGPGKVTIFHRFTNNNWRVAAVTDRNGNHVGYEYDPAGNGWRPVGLEDGDGRRLDIEYGPQGITNVTDHTGRSAQLVYEEDAPDNATNDCLRFVMDAVGRTNRFDYTWTMDQYGGRDIDLIAAHTRPVGNTPWQNAWTALMFYAEDPYEMAAVAFQEDAYSNRVDYLYDTNTHELAVTWPDSTTNRYASAARHLPPSDVTDSAGGQTVFVRNDNLQAESVTDRSGGVTSFGFDPETRLTTAITNPSGDAMTFEYGVTTQTVVNPITLEAVEFVFRDLAARRYPDGTSEMFERDGRGNVTGRVDRAGGLWTFEYDARGNLLRRVSPAGGISRWTYTTNALPESATTVGGGTNLFTYDHLGRLASITYPDGTWQAYDYDPAGRLLSVSNDADDAWTYEYDANGNLTRAVGPTGAEKVYTYDLMDRIATNAPSFAEATRFEYDPMGWIARSATGGITNEFHRDALGSVTNEQRGRVRRMATYDASGRPATVARAGYGSVEIQRNAQGLVTGRVDSTGFAVQAWRDPNGVVTQTVDSLARTTAWSYADGRLVSVELPGAGADARAYDNGRLSAYTDRGGRTWRYGYTPEGLLAAVTNPAGGARRYSYDLLGRLEILTLEDGASWAYGYDARGGLAEITTPGTSTWCIARNALGQPLAVTNPAGGVATRTYTADGLPETFATSDAGVFSNTYDSLRRLVERVRPDGATTAYTYEPVNGWLAAVTTPEGAVWTRAYDASGRTAALVDPDGVTNSVEYDARGRVTAAVARAEARVAFSYDAAGRLIQTAGPDGTGRQITYDDLNRPVVVSLGGITNRFEYDAAGRLSALSNSLLGTERCWRDARGAVTSRVDAAGNATRYERDAVGRAVEIEPPAGPLIQLDYDADGALVRVELPGGIVETYDVDELGGLAGWTDANGGTWTVERSPMGRLEATVDPLHRTNRFIYNTNGWLAGIEFSDGASRAYQYNLDGAVTAEVYAAAAGGGAEETLTWVYDELGTLVAADGLALAHDAMGRVVETVCHGVTNGTAYDAAGRLAELDYGGIMTVTYQVEPATARITNQFDSLTGTQITYEYDGQGRLTGIRRSNGQNAAFTRGADGSVTRIADGTVLDLEYAYDANGRITSVGGTWPLEAGPNLAAETNAWTYDAAGQISSAGYAYNDRGQATATPGRTIAWLDDRPAAMDGMTLSYSGLDHLLELEGSATPTKLYYNLGLGDVPVRENNRLYVWSPAGRLLYFVDLNNGNAVYFYHPDANGSMLAISDGSGTVVQAYAYDPFGQIVAESGGLNQPFTSGGEHGFLRMDAFVGTAPLGKRDDDGKDDLFVKGKHARDGGTGDALWTDEAEIDRFIANYDALIAGEEAKIKALDEKMKNISNRISDARTYGNNPFYWTAGLILAVVDDENYWPDNAWHNYDEARRQRAFVMNRVREFEREKRKWQARKDALHPKQTPIVTAKTREIDRKIGSRQDLIGRARTELRARDKEIQEEEDKLRQLKLLNKYSIPYVTDGMDKKLEDARVERIMNLQSIRNDYRRQIDRLEGEIEELEEEKLMEQAETAIAEAQLMDDFLKAAAPVIAEKVKNEGGSHRRGWVKGLKIRDELRALIPEEYQAVYDELDEIQQATTKRVEAEKPAAPALPLLNENELPDPVAVPPPKTEGNSATIEDTFVDVPAFSPAGFDEKAAAALNQIMPDPEAMLEAARNTPVNAGELWMESQLRKAEFGYDPWEIDPNVLKHSMENTPVNAGEIWMDQLMNKSK